MLQPTNLQRLHNGKYQPRNDVYAFTKREKQLGNFTCPFCRDALYNGDTYQKLRRRIEANDPSAMNQMGMARQKDGNYVEAFHYCSKAAEMGHAKAHYNLSVMYDRGDGVEKDEKKRVYHLEEAAILGHPGARFSLARYETMKGRFDRAVKHLIIAANQGNDKSMGALKACYQDGSISKDDFASALRAHHAAVDATKSPDREVGMNTLESNLRHEPMLQRYLSANFNVRDLPNIRPSNKNRQLTLSREESEPHEELSVPSFWTPA